MATRKKPNPSRPSGMKPPVKPGQTVSNTPRSVRPPSGGGPGGRGVGGPGRGSVSRPNASGSRGQTEATVSGLTSGVGNYAGRTLNLSNRQLREAGVKKPGQMRTVNISSTTYDAAAKRVMGPKGNPLTGRVDLGGGNFAVYVEGRRVRAPRPGTQPSGGRGGGGSGRPATGSYTGGSSGTSTDNVNVPPPAAPNADRPSTAPVNPHPGFPARPPSGNQSGPLAPVNPNRPSVSQGQPTRPQTYTPYAGNSSNENPYGVNPNDVPWLRSSRAGKGRKRK